MMSLTLAKPCPEVNLPLWHPVPNSEPRWYAACTQPRHEKTVAKFLAAKHIESYLPLHRKVCSWNGRRAEVDLPLFPGYVFVKLPLEQRIKVLESPSVRSFVSFSGKPAALPDEEIEALKASLALRCAEPYPFLQTGRRVRIAYGPLQGLQGKILRRKGKLRMIVSVDFLQRSIAVDLEPADLLLAA